MAVHKVYFSYAWGDESEKVAEEVEKVLQKKGVKTIRDKKILNYKGMITPFMQEIGKANAIIVVISDKYLKSKNCTFELSEIADNKNFYNRIFPIVLEDAKIYDALDIREYINHWDEEIKKLNTALKGLESLANTQGIREDIDLYTKIRSVIASLVNIFRDMNTLTLNQHQSLNYKDLYEALKKVKVNSSQVTSVNRPQGNLQRMWNQTLKLIALIIIFFSFILFYFRKDIIYRLLFTNASAAVEELFFPFFLLLLGLFILNFKLK